MSDFARTSDNMHLFMQIAAGFLSTKYSCLGIPICGIELEERRTGFGIWDLGFGIWGLGFGCQGPAAGKEQEPHCLKPLLSVL